MGLSTAAVFAMLFALGVTAVTYLLSVQEEYSVILGYEEEKASERISDEIHSDIEITDVTYSGGDLVITVNNTGSTVLDLGHVYLVINDTWVPEDSYSITLLQSPSNGYWEPTESIEITYTTVLSGAVTVKVVAETGVEDRYEYGS